METRVSNFADPTTRPPALRRQRVAKQPKAGRSRLLTARCQATRLNRRSGRRKLWRRIGHAFVARVPLNSYYNARTISCPVPSSIRRSSRSTPLWHAWIRRGGILPVRLQRKLFPTQPYLRRDEAYQRTRLPCAVVLRNNLPP